MQKYFNFRNNIDLEELKEPAKVIRNGGIVIFPTETVYGIGTNGFDEKSIKKIYELKRRDSNKPISLLVSNIEMVEMVAKDISDLEYKLMRKFWPGPFTIILKKKSIVPDILTSNGDTVGVRMPSGEIAKKLIEYAEVPIAAPSANISGKPSGIDINDIMKDFEEIAHQAVLAELKLVHSPVRHLGTERSLDVLKNMQDYLDERITILNNVSAQSLIVECEQVKGIKLDNGEVISAELLNSCA